MFFTNLEHLKSFLTGQQWLTAYNDTGETVSAIATVTVKPPLPVIVSFTAAPSQIFRGDSSTLTWKTQNATRVVLSDGSGQVREVPLNGSLQVQPEKTTAYLLSAFNEAGEVVSATITVSVTVPFF